MFELVAIALCGVSFGLWMDSTPAGTFMVLFLTLIALYIEKILLTRFNKQ